MSKYTPLWNWIQENGEDSFKLTGILLFAFPLSAAMMDIRYSAAVVCVAATFAAIHEGHVIRTIR